MVLPQRPHREHDGQCGGRLRLVRIVPEKRRDNEARCPGGNESNRLRGKPPIARPWRPQDENATKMADGQQGSLPPTGLECVVRIAVVNSLVLPCVPVFVVECTAVRGIYPAPLPRKLLPAKGAWQHTQATWPRHVARRMPLDVIKPSRFLVNGTLPYPVTGGR